MFDKALEAEKMTSRLVVIENAQIKKEAVAPRIVINWNPHDNSGDVEFWVQIMETINEDYQGLKPDPRFQLNPMRYSLADILNMVFDVPVGVDVEGNIVYTQVPGMLLMGTIKAAFEKMLIQKLQEMDQAVQPPPQPANSLPDPGAGTTEPEVSES